MHFFTNPKKISILLFLSSVIISNLSLASDLSWVKNYTGKYSYDFIKDPKAKALLNEISGSTKCKGKNISNEVWQNLSGPGEPIGLRLNRYFSVHACRAHACHKISLIWLDITGNKKAVAFVSLLDNKVYLSSNDFESKDSPDEFYNDVKLWLKTLNWGKKIPQFELCKPNGKNVNIDSLIKF